MIADVEVNTFRGISSGQPLANSKIVNRKSSVLTFMNSFHSGIPIPELSYLCRAICQVICTGTKND